MRTQRGDINHSTKHPWFVDMSDQKVGSWTVVKHVGCMRSKSGHRIGTGWLCRCDCGAERVIAGAALRARQRSRCRRCASAARTVPKAERVCRWCGRPSKAGTGERMTGGAARECGACQRTAVRNGREPDGRPIAKGPRRVVLPEDAADCALCGGPLPAGRPRFCSPRCAREVDRAKRVVQSRIERAGGAA